MSSFEVAKLKRQYTFVSTLVKKDHHQLDVIFIVNVISTIVINKLSMMVASMHDEIKLYYKYKISYDKV